MKLGICLYFMWWCFLNEGENKDQCPFSHVFDPHAFMEAMGAAVAIIAQASTAEG